MKKFLKIIPIFLFFLLSSCSQINPCDISIVFPQHSIVENGGWQSIYFIPYSDEYSNCNEFMDMTDEQLQDISETYSTIPIILSTLTGKDFSRLTHGRYYIVVRAKDLKCNFHWERCKDINLNQCSETALEIGMNEKTDPVECDGLCMEGSCEIIECENDEKCINDNVCDGAEYCGQDNICHNGEVVENGYECNSDDNITTEEICVSGQCVGRRCGDGFVEQQRGEQCDPPNELRCSQDCKWINNTDAGSDTSQDILIDINNCVDNDGDNYGVNCTSGPDCDDTAITCTNNCDVDIDNDQIPDCKDTCTNCTFCPENAYEVGYYDNMEGQTTAVAATDNYAFIGNGGNLRIIDITNPASPFEVGYYETPGSLYDIAVSGSYAYIADGPNGGLRIIDISNPASPQETGYYDTPDNAQGIAVSGNYAYIADLEGGMLIIDVSNPASPFEASYVGQITYSVAATEDYAFIGTSYNGLRIIDIRNPENPLEIGYYPASGKVAVSGDYAFIAALDQGLRVIDIHDPANPQEVGFYITPDDAQGIVASGDYVFVASCNSGLRIIDVSNPANPFEAGYYDTWGLSWNAVVSGSYAFIADDSSGLRIIDISCE